MMDYQLRPSVVEERDGLAPVLQRAFTQFNISVGIPPEVDLETAESATHLLDEVLMFPSYGITAVDKDSGLPIGAAFLNFQGELVQRIGPVFVDPYRSNRGVGKALMNALIDKAKATNAISIRLLQITANTKSFSLYAKLGFRPVECISYFEGTLNENVNTQATGLTGYKIRRMEESDVHLCSELHRKVMGHERESDIRGKLQMNLGNAWVLMKDDILQAYTTGFCLDGHSIAQSEETLITLFRAVSYQKEGRPLTIHIPGRIYPRLLEWAFKGGLKLLRHCWMMVIGHYQPPQAEFVWCPSILG